MTPDSRSYELSASKTCVVTGATDGIGLVTARELARVGWQVTIVGRSKAKCQAAVVGIIEAVDDDGLEEIEAQRGDGDQGSHLSHIHIRSCRRNS